MTDLTNKEITGPFSGLIKVKEGLSNLLFESQKKGKGIYLGDKLQDWLKDMIRSRLQYALTLEENRNSQRYQLASTLCEKEEVTFADLAQLSKLFPELNMKGMCFTGTNYTDQTLDVFNVHETPDMPVTLAIRISVSLPWFFKSIKYNGKEYMDGGCLDNYPMGIFDAPPFKPTEKLKLTSGEYGQNLCTLGFKVDSTEEIRKVLWEGRQEDNTGFFGQLLQGVKDKVTDLCVGVNNTEANKATNKAVYGKYAQRTVQIPDLEYSTFNFDLTNEDKDKLALAGKKATLEWFSLYYDGAGIELELNDVQELSSYLSNEEFAAVKKRALDL